MKKILFPFLFAATFSFAQCPESFHDFTVLKINGDTMNLSDLAGKKVMVVNTASFCAYTPQYADLEQLYTTYGGPTFEIIGFPCNDFGGQEPGDDETIDSFCVGNNITFPMMHKISITASDTAPVYKWLQLHSRNCVANAPVSWNFNKFLIDEAGNWIAHYNSPVSPLDQAIIDWILLPNTTGINNHDNQTAVTLLSNPVNESINLKLTQHQPADLKIKLFSISGQFVADVFSGSVNSTASVNFPVNNLEDGVYFLSVISQAVTKSYKIVIVK